jgi:selenocysteine-specific translation elongation factor
MLKEHPAAHIEIIPTSSEKNKGIDELRAEIARLAQI